jgi:RHS repeat-associated protein
MREVTDDNGQGQVYYLHGDHLGSVSMVTGNNTANLTKLATDSRIVGVTRYKPWGEERAFSAALAGVTPTDFRFTGQRRSSPGTSYVGALMDYNARHYDPVTGRFVSADSIVPDPTNPQSFNRFTYVSNNPSVRVDPSGHGDCNVHVEDECIAESANDVSTRLFHVRKTAQARLRNSPRYVVPKRDVERVYRSYGYSEQSPKLRPRVQGPLERPGFTMENRRDAENKFYRDVGFAMERLKPRQPPLFGRRSDYRFGEISVPLFPGADLGFGVAKDVYGNDYRGISIEIGPGTPFQPAYGEGWIKDTKARIVSEAEIRDGITGTSLSGCAAFIVGVCGTILGGNSIEMKFVLGAGLEINGSYWEERLPGVAYH